MPKNPHADFSPVLDGYSGIGAFRFWCQTALPLTYDDSLSYYELLNKVVNYLNHTIEDLTSVENNTSALAEAYNKLQKYVNDYFDDLDIEAELRNVLDAMAEDGTLDALLDPLVENQLPGIVNEKIDGVVADQIDGAVAGQIDESVADQLPALVDAGIPGEVSDWLEENVDPVGSAVMVDSSLTISGAAADAKVTGDELSDLKTHFSNIANTVCVISKNLLNFNDPDFVTNQKLSETYGYPVASSGTNTTGFIAVEEGKTYNLEYGTNISTSQLIGRVCAYDENKAYLSSYTQDNERGFTVPVNSGIAYIRLSQNGTYLNSEFQNVMITDGIPDRYYPYFDPYYEIKVKNSALVMDDTPTDESNNPVKSDGIFTALQAKQNTLTFDDTPTSGSNNPVKSGGIYTSLTQINNVISAVTESTSENLFDKDHPLTKALYINPSTSKFANSGDIRLVYVAVEHNTDYTVKCGGESKKRYGFCADVPAALGDVSNIVEVTGTLNASANSGNGNYLAIQLFSDTDSDKTASNYYSSIEISTSQLTAKDSVSRTGVSNLESSKQDKLTFDDTPISGSDNPVKSGGIYDAITPAVGMVESKLVVSKNLLNFDDSDFVTDQKLSTTTGDPVTASGVNTTGYIDVEEGKTYILSYGTNANTSQVISRVCAYDENKNYLSTYTQDNNRGYTVPAESGIAFIRLSQNADYLKPDNNAMISDGIQDRYHEYFTPYNSYTVKNSALDADYISELGGEKKTVFPNWELGSFNNSWNLTDSTNTIRSDYIPVGNKITISVDNRYQAKIYPFSLSGDRLQDQPFICTSEITLTNADASFIRISFSATIPVTISDANTYGLGVTITRYGNTASFDTLETAYPNVPNPDPNKVLPQYLALVAVKENNVLNKMSETVGYLYRTVVAPYKLYYAQGRPDNIHYLCDWDTTLPPSGHTAPMYYCFAVSYEGDIICVHRGEISDSTLARVNPIVYPHTDYTHPVIVDVGTEKPTSWISNSGVYCEEGHVWFGEYIRNVHTHANVWDVSAPYTNASDWVIAKSYERDSDPSDPSSMVLGKIEHIHHVSRDPFSGVLYVTTGDHYTEARIDYLKNGTWGVLAEGDEEVCRQLNFVYTPTYIYWASDAFSIYDPDTQQMIGGAHKFFRATRTQTGLIDLDNLDRYQLKAIDGSIATYHVSYIKDPECILILDRHDADSAYLEMPYRVWNIKEERLEFAGNMKQTRGTINQYLGYRCECCQHYPNLFDSELTVGFSLYPNSIAVCGNPNPDIIPSQGGRTTNDGKNAEQVNSMRLKVILN